MSMIGGYYIQKTCEYFLGLRIDQSEDTYRLELISLDENTFKSILQKLYMYIYLLSLEHYSLHLPLG